jgi:hypothetical protein
MDIKIGKNKVLIVYQRPDAKDYTQNVSQTLFGSFEDFEFMTDGQTVNIQFKDKIVLSENISNITLNGSMVTAGNLTALIEDIINNDNSGGDGGSSSSEEIPQLNCSFFTGINGSGNSNGATYYQVEAPDE